MLKAQPPGGPEHPGLGGPPAGPPPVAPAVRAVPPHNPTVKSPTNKAPSNARTDVFSCTTYTPSLVAQAGRASPSFRGSPALYSRPRRCRRRRQRSPSHTIRSTRRRRRCRDDFWWDSDKNSLRIYR
ncbi:MAG: hypothetical protein DMF67_02640 [Acidobacteria bacterium]|nr:MAG: hypothetical protein DMF67_02640 [Acidobacteriota bacterium]